MDEAYTNLLTTLRRYRVEHEHPLWMQGPATQKALRSRHCYLGPATMKSAVIRIRGRLARQAALRRLGGQEGRR